MRLHLPKPMHGWRAFFGEVGVIVLGVMIALAASQLVERWQWGQQIKQADEAFGFELQAAVQNAYVRLATEPCLTHRLADIEAKLNEPGENWRAMPESLNFPDADLAAPYHAYLPAPAITTNAWTNALANGVVSHLPTLRASYLSDAYDAMSRFKDDRREEGMTIPKLAPLATDRTLTSENRIAMLQSVRELQHLDGLIEDDSQAVLFTVEEAGSGFTDDLIRSESAPLVVMARKVRGQCVTEPKMPSAS